MLPPNGPVTRSPQSGAPDRRPLELPHRLEHRQRLVGVRRGERMQPARPRVHALLAHDLAVHAPQAPIALPLQVLGPLVRQVVAHKPHVLGGRGKRGPLHAAPRDLPLRRVAIEDPSAGKPPGKPAMEEEQHQRAGVNAVRVRIEQQDDLAVARVGHPLARGRRAFVEPDAEGPDQRRELLVRPQLVQAVLVGVHRLALHREQGLERGIADLGHGACGRIALHDVKLSLGTLRCAR